MNRYAFTEWNEHMAKAKGAGLPISAKMAMEICTHIRGKPLLIAKRELQEIAALRLPLPLRRFHKDRGHKAKIGPGAYPVKAAREIGRLLESAEANAQSQGLGDSLVIRHICAHRASQPGHYGRFHGRKMKRTHVEVVLEEAKESGAAKRPARPMAKEKKAKEAKGKKHD